MQELVTQLKTEFPALVFKKKFGVETQDTLQNFSDNAYHGFYIKNEKFKCWKGRVCKKNIFVVDLKNKRVVFELKK